VLPKGLSALEVQSATWSRRLRAALRQNRAKGSHVTNGISRTEARSLKIHLGRGEITSDVVR
jgi:hypothetical protein